MPLPNNFEQFIRVHHIAFYTWLRTCLVDYGEVPQGSGNDYKDVPIIATRSGVERAFGTIAQLLLRHGWVPGDSQSEREQNAKNYDVIPAPFCTYNITEDPTPDPGRAFGAPMTMRKLRFNAATGEYESHRAPTPWRCGFVVNLFCRKRYTEQHFRNWLYEQLGAVGAGNAEIFIPVAHAEPWGTLVQAIKFTGSSDNSELEGDNQRFLRVDFNFDFSMWYMHPPVATAPPVSSKQFHIATTGVNYGVDHLENVTVQGATFSQSENMAGFMAARTGRPDAWNKTLATTVAKVDVRPVKATMLHPDVQPTLKIDYVGGDPEFVTVADGLAAVGANGLGVTTVQFQYRSTRPVYLTVAHGTGADASVPTQLYRATLPIATAWRKFSRAIVTDLPVYFVALETMEGSLPCTTYVFDLDVRNIYASPHMPPTEKRSHGDNWQYVWKAVGALNHLLVCKADHDAEIAVGVFADADDAAPVVTRTLNGTDDEWRTAMLVRPTGTTLGLTVPKSVASPVVYALPFLGAYEGHTI